MPKPFPLPLNIGTDICSIPRVYKILCGSSGAGLKFVRRILTAEECQKYHLKAENPVKRWIENLQRRKDIDMKRMELYISTAELSHCLECQRARERGQPIDWLRNFRLKKRKQKGIFGTQIKDAMISLDKDTFNSTPESARVTVGKWDSSDKYAYNSSHEDTEFTVGESSLSGDTTAETVEPAPQNPPLPYSRMRSKNADEGLNDLLEMVQEYERSVIFARSRLLAAAGFMAGRFAAKEAIMKAHHGERLTYHRIAILPATPNTDTAGSRPPVAAVIPEGGKWEDGQEVRISISHDGDYATAVCLAPTS